MATLFEKNIALWSRSNPKQAVLLQYRIPKKKAVPSSTEEGKVWFANLDLKGAAALFIYGIGKGDYFYPLIEWLKKDRSRRVVFLEDDLDVLHPFFQTQVATEVLSHPQV